MRVFRKLMSFALVLSMLAGFALMGGLPTVSAAATAQNLATLLSEGKIKALGRTTANADGTAIRTDWSGTGFDMNYNATANTVTIGYTAEYDCYWAAIVDGEQVWRGLLSKSANEVSFTVPKGGHTLRFVKETQMPTNGTGFDLTTVALTGTIGTAPANKSLYMEFIGDSYTCGDGALGTYVAGKAWASIDDSATHSYAYMTAEALNADYSLVARGGIGLTSGTSVQEGTTMTAAISDIYPFASGYRDMTGTTEYDFARQPDIIVMPIGANDTFNAAWVTALGEMVQLIRAKNPDAAIVLTHRSMKYYKAMYDLAQTLDNVYAFCYVGYGNGSAALTRQYEGHPDAADHAYISEQLVAFLEQKGLVNQPAEETYNDIVYYANGTTNWVGGDGKTAETAVKGSAEATFKQIKADNGDSFQNFPNGTRLVIRVTGGIANGNQAIGNVTETLTCVDGTPVPILFEGYGTGTNSIISTHKPSNSGSCYWYTFNDITFRNIRLKANAYKASGSDTYSEFMTSNFYANGHDVVFDNVTFVSDTNCTNSVRHKWSIGADTAVGPNDVEAAFDGSITFLNGNYTNLNIVAAAMNGSWWRSDANGKTLYEHANATCTLTIGKGAIMGDVYGAYGSVQIKQVTVNLAGGTVANYYGTGSGTSSAKKTFNTPLTTNMTGATITSKYWGMGENITVNAKVTNNISGGQMYLTPSNTNGVVFFGAGGSATVNADLETNISGGNILVNAIATQSGGVYFGNCSGNINGNVTNNVTGGAIMYADGTGSNAKQGYVSVHFGSRSGNITGTLTNNLSYCNIEGNLANSTSVYFGGQSLGCKIGKVVNVFGEADTYKYGPRFSVNGTVYLAGGWSLLGDPTKTSNTALPADGTLGEGVVVSNTIYNCYSTTTVYCGSSSGYYATGPKYHYALGDIVTNVYGGTYQGGFYCASSGAPVYGHVTANIYGGLFHCFIAGGYSANIYDGLEVNLYKYGDLYDVNKAVDTNNKNTKKVDAMTFTVGDAGKTENAGSTGTVTATTAGRTPLALNILADAPADVTINVPMKSTADVALTIRKGTFPMGLSMNGAAVAETAIAAGSKVMAKDSTELALTDAVSTYAVVNEVTTKVHCVCGARSTETDPTGNCKGDCDGTLITWQPWLSANSLPKAATEAGYYYLTADVTTTGQTSMKADENNQHTVFGIDFNGKTVTRVAKAGSESSARAIVAFGANDADNTEYTTDVILTDSSENKGALVIDASNITTGNKSQGGALWVRHGNITVYGITVDGTKTATSGNGAAVCMDKGRTFKAYDATILGGSTTGYGGALYASVAATVVLDNCTVTGGSALVGGNIFAGGSSNVTIVDTAISGGTGTNAGGNIFCNPGSAVTVIGGSVIDGTAYSSDGKGNVGGNIEVCTNDENGPAALTVNGATVGAALAGHSIYVSAGNVTVLGAPQITDMYLRTGSLNTVNAIEVDLTGVTGGSVDVDMETVGYYGKCTEAALAYIVTDKAYYTDEAKTQLANYVPIVYDGILYLSRGTVANVIHSDGTVSEYTTLREAVANSTEADIVRETYTVVDRVVVPANQNLYFDIDGATARGTITLSQGKKVYVMDSATDTFADTDTYQLCTMDISGGEYFTGSFKAPNSKRYFVQSITGSTYNKIQSNRFYVGFTKVYMEPCKTNFNAGYRMAVAGNKNVQAVLGETFGMKLWVEGNEENAAKLSLAKAEFKAGADYTTIFATVNNILGVDDAQKATAAAADIKAEAELTVNGEKFTAQVSMNLKQMVEAADAAFATLTADQQSCLKVCYDRYASLMSSWSITNMK